MNSCSRIIKAEDVKMIDLWAKPPTGFVRGLCDTPSYEREETGEQVAEEVAIEEEETPEEIAEKEDARKKIADQKAYKELMESTKRDKKGLSMSSQSVAKLIRELGAVKEKMLESSEKEMLDLVFLVAGKVIHREVDTDRGIVLSVLRDAMKTMRGNEDVRIRMNPEDYRYITEATPDFLGSYGDIMIEKDEKIGRGGAVIETHSGAVDARLDGQLDKVRDAVYNEHGF